MRTTISLPDDLLEDAKRSAAARGVTLSAYVEVALRREVVDEAQPNVAPFELVTVGGELVRPETDLRRASQLLVEDDMQQLSRTGRSHAKTGLAGPR